MPLALTGVPHVGLAPTDLRGLWVLDHMFAGRFHPVSHGPFPQDELAAATPLVSLGQLSIIPGKARM